MLFAAKERQHRETTGRGFQTPNLPLQRVREVTFSQRHYQNHPLDAGPEAQPSAETSWLQNSGTVPF